MHTILNLLTTLSNIYYVTALTIQTFCIFLQSSILSYQHEQAGISKDSIQMISNVRLKSNNIDSDPKIPCN